MPEQQETPQLSDELFNTLLAQLIAEAREIIDHLNLCVIQLDQDTQDQALFETVKRGFHTIKGSAGFVGLDQLSVIAKAFEMLMAEVLKGNIQVSTPMVHLMYEGLDAIAAIIDKAEAKDFSAIDAVSLLDRADALMHGRAPAPQVVAGDCDGDQGLCFDESLEVHRDGYRQLMALKEMILSSLHHSDPETLVVLLSRQLHTYMGPGQHSFWLAHEDKKFIEIARDGQPVEMIERRALDAEAEGWEWIQRVMDEPFMVWPTDGMPLPQELSEYRSPVIFPLHFKASLLGLLLLEPQGCGGMEIYQLMTHFAAMMISIAALHQKVKEQRAALDEMTGILFRQNIAPK